MGVLDQVLAAKREEVQALRARATELEAAAQAAPPARDFAGALEQAEGLAIIAEIKRRSPSKGELAPGLDPSVTARSYEAGGAAALSVLTDARFFGGSLDDLRAAREAGGLPVLRKDFTVDPLQLLEARAAGADAVLLIVAALDDATFGRLLARADALGLAALVEVHDEDELDRALTAGTALVGVNCRDLRTFDEDLGVADRLAAAIPSGVVAIAESALRSVDDARRMAAAGYRAALVGEALLRSDDPTALVAALADVPVTTTTTRR